jgi:hypothetical protein
MYTRLGIKIGDTDGKHGKTYLHVIHSTDACNAQERTHWNLIHSDSLVIRWVWDERRKTKDERPRDREGGCEVGGDTCAEATCRIIGHAQENRRAKGVPEKHAHSAAPFDSRS